MGAFTSGTQAASEIHESGILDLPLVVPSLPSTPIGNDHGGGCVPRYALCDPNNSECCGLDECRRRIHFGFGGEIGEYVCSPLQYINLRSRQRLSDRNGHGGAGAAARMGK